MLLMAAPSPDGDGRVADLITRVSARTGEHVAIRRTQAIAAPGGVVASYVHNAAAAATGTIGVLVALEGPTESLAAIGRQVSMHVAASGPQWVSAADIPAALLVEKRAELYAQAETSGKPPAVVEKMVEGRLRKFSDDVALLRQPFIIDPDRTVGQVLVEASIRVLAFVRYRVGDTIPA
jgi:elongation factor Ts